MTDPKRKPVPVIDDPELFELFGDDAGSLAVVDAIAATQRVPARRSKRTSRALVLAAAVVVIAIVAGIFRLSSSNAGVIEKALKAVSSSAVVHLRLVDANADANALHVTSGRQSSIRYVLDEWVAPSTGTVRSLLSVRGVPISDTTTQGHFADGADAAAESFAGDYRTALRNRTAREVAGPRVAGRRVHWVALTNRRGVPIRVAVDARTYRPVLVRYPTQRRTFTVTRVGASSREALNARSSSAPSLGPASVSAAKPASTNDIPEAWRPLAPASTGGLPLVRVRRLEVVGANATDRAFELVYAANAAKGQSGALPTKYLRLTIAARPLAALGWTPWYVLPEDNAWVTNRQPFEAFVHLPTAFVSMRSTAGQAPLSAALRASR